MQGDLRQTLFPRYCGVNLDGMFCTDDSIYSVRNSPACRARRGCFLEKDFIEAADLGFDFVRLPLSYRLFSSDRDRFLLDDGKLEHLDRAVEWGRRHHLHVDINFHRAPGYCVNADVPDDPILLYRDDEALEYFVKAWEKLASRYRGIPNDQVSFDLLNEPSPSRFSLDRYVQVMKAAIAAIHRIDPQRFIMIDGWDWGDTPIEELAGIPLVGQSMRGYHPRELTHYPNFYEDKGTPAAWPCIDRNGRLFDYGRLESYVRGWAEFSVRTGTPVHCGECGAWVKAPHDLVIKWADDFLGLLKKYNIGWAWWTMHGDFGICRGNDTRPDPELVEVMRRNGARERHGNAGAASAAAGKGVRQGHNMKCGCNYWASNAGTQMWARWDEAAVRNDFRLMKEIGLKTVRVFPSWRDFQPIDVFAGMWNTPREVRMHGGALPDTELGRCGVDEVMVQRFRTMAQIAGENGLELIVSLLTGWMSGLMLVPPALAGRNLITDPFALKWEVRFLRAMVRALKDCPAIVMWEAGNECNAFGPSNREEGWLWTSLITTTIRAEDPTRPIASGLHGITPGNDTDFSGARDMWTIQGQGENCDYVTGHPYPFSVSKTPARVDRYRSMRTAFQAAVESRFYGDIAGKPGFVEEIGAWSTGGCCHETKALFIRNSMFNCWAHNSSHFLWWCGFEHSVLPYPPYDWSTMERELGLFDERMRPRPVALEMKIFSQLMDSLPFRELPPFRKDAVCLLSRGQSYDKCLRNEWSTFMLAKHCGFDIEFAYAGHSIPDSGCYIVPGITSDQWMFDSELGAVLARVRNGATMFISIDDTMPTRFRELFGCRVIDREARTAPAQVMLGDGVFSIAAPYRMILQPEDCEVLATEDGGNPVMVRSEYGRGQIFLLTLPLELHLGAIPAVFDSDRLGAWRRFYLETFAGKLLAGRRVRSNCPQLTLTEHDGLPGGKSCAIAVNNTDHDMGGELLSFADGWCAAEPVPEIAAHSGIVIVLERRQGGDGPQGAPCASSSSAETPSKKESHAV